jgi:hypothetical protein
MAARRKSNRWARPCWAAVLAAAAGVAAGCAAGPGMGWADIKSRQKINELADDDSFPSAAEAGLKPTPDKADDAG